MKVVGYASRGQLQIIEACPQGLSIKVRAQADERYNVPMAEALEPLEGVTLTDGDGWWNDDENVYTVPIDFPNWGARIEVHGHSIDEARALALRVLDGLT